MKEKNTVWLDRFSNTDSDFFFENIFYFEKNCQKISDFPKEWTKKLNHFWAKKFPWFLQKNKTQKGVNRLLESKWFFCYVFIALQQFLLKIFSRLTTQQLVNNKSQIFLVENENGAIQELKKKDLSKQTVACCALKCALVKQNYQ